MPKKVVVCKYCSGFKVKELKDFVPDKEYKVKCFKECLRKNPKFEGKVYGMLGGKLVVRDTKEEFFDEIKKIL